LEEATLPCGGERYHAEEATCTSCLVDMRRRQRYHAEEATCTSCLVDMHLHARREERSNKEEG